MKIEHTAVYVDDLEGAKDFFVRYFDGQANNRYENKAKGFSSYFIRFDDGSRLELMSQADVQKTCLKKHLGFAHIAFSVGNKQKVSELTSRLANDGYDIVSEPRTTGDGYFESCILDKEGNMIEITI